MITRTIGITGVGAYNDLSPSTADVTVMAGVIIPSASNALAPVAATINVHRDLILFFYEGEKSHDATFSVVVGTKSHNDIF